MISDTAQVHRSAQGIVLLVCHELWGIFADVEEGALFDSLWLSKPRAVWRRGLQGMQNAREFIAQGWIAETKQVSPRVSLNQNTDESIRGSI